jgi:anti-sigma-K factor RskA
MADERLLELLPAQALGALDPEDRAYVESRLGGDAEARRELAALEAAAARIGLSVAPVPPGPPLRQAILRATRPPAKAAPAAFARAWGAWLAAAAALVCAVGLLVVRAQRDDARRAASLAQARAETAEAQAREFLADLETTRALLAQERELRGLLGRAETRLVSLGGLPAAPQARARMLFRPDTREACLLASGLAAPPAGKAYEVWVIAQGAPVPAGVFKPDAQGAALFRLPDVPAIAGVKTFAITLEPEGGVPAPTGPMVLAGAVS